MHARASRLDLRTSSAGCPGCPNYGLELRATPVLRATPHIVTSMGLASSLPEESAYAPFQALGLGYTEELVRSYKERDLDFGIDLPTIEGLTGLDRDQCIQLVESLAKNDPGSEALNALYLQAPASLARKWHRSSFQNFDIFDFDARGQIPGMS